METWYSLLGVIECGRQVLHDLERPRSGSSGFEECGALGRAFLGMNTTGRALRLLWCRLGREQP